MEDAFSYFTGEISCLPPVNNGAESADLQEERAG
jgi:hypothetical protein